MDKNAEKLINILLEKIEELEAKNIVLKYDRDRYKKELDNMATGGNESVKEF